MNELVLRLKILRRRGLSYFWNFRETGQFPSQTTTSSSQLGAREINIADLCVTIFDAVFDFPLEMERPFDDAALLHFISDCLFRSDLPLHDEFSSWLEKFIAERIAS